MTAARSCVSSSRSAATAAGIVSAHWRLCLSVRTPSSPRSANRRDSWTVSMLEVAAALCAGLGATAATLSIAAPAPVTHDNSVAPPWIERVVRKRWALEIALVTAAGWPGLGAAGLVVVEVSVALVGGFAAALVTGLPVLALAGAVGAIAVVRGAVTARARAQQVLRQDAVLEAVRMLRQLLETGANGVNTAIAVLGERGPAPLRSEFRIIAATSVGRRQAWNAARQRVGEPLPCRVPGLAPANRGGGDDPKLRPQGRRTTLAQYGDGSVDSIRAGFQELAQHPHRLQHCVLAQNLLGPRSSGNGAAHNRNRAYGTCESQHRQPGDQGRGKAANERDRQLDHGEAGSAESWPTCGGDQRDLQCPALAHHSLDPRRSN